MPWTLRTIDSNGGGQLTSAAIGQTDGETYGGADERLTLDFVHLLGEL
jgi:hypothetical protein